MTPFGGPHRERSRDIINIQFSVRGLSASKTVELYKELCSKNLFIKFLDIGSYFRVPMFYLDSFLRTTDPPFDNSTSYGDVIKDNLFSNNGSLWKQSPKFPRRVFCEFSIRQFMNIHQHTVQCQLPMNEFTEAVYIFLWVWFLIVAVITPISFAVWILRVALPFFRRRYISRCLHVGHEGSNIQTLNLDKFADWVGEDGVMTLKLIAENSSELLVADIVYNMWLRRVDETGSNAAEYNQMVPEAIPLSVPTAPMYPPLE